MRCNLLQFRQQREHGLRRRATAGLCAIPVAAALTCAAIPAALADGGNYEIAVAPAGAPAPACVAWTGVQPPNPGTTTSFGGVATLSARNAWATGSYSSGTVSHTLIEHWNGSAWTQTPSPNPSPTGSFLGGVAATSASNIWAVGEYDSGAAEQTLVLHWNGTAWKRVPSPNPGGPAASDFLTGVTATSASNAWAVGQYASVGGEQALVLHWNGTAWRQVPSPKLYLSGLTGVAATSSRNAWAVGSDGNRTAGSLQTLVLHWNGTAWKHVPSPDPGGSLSDNFLSGVAATSASSAWAVGSYSNDAAGVVQTIILRWNGTAWKHVRSPDPGGSSTFNVLDGVAATSASNAWAVGEYFHGTTDQTLVLHWNGTAWKRVRSPDPGGSSTVNELAAVAATSPGNIWAVGGYSTAIGGDAIALHRC